MQRVASPSTIRPCMPGSVLRLSSNLLQATQVAKLQWTFKKHPTSTIIRTPAWLLYESACGRTLGCTDRTARPHNQRLPIRQSTTAPYHNCGCYCQWLLDPFLLLNTRASWSVQHKNVGSADTVILTTTRQPRCPDCCATCIPTLSASHGSRTAH